MKSSLVTLSRLRWHRKRIVLVAMQCFVGICGSLGVAYIQSHIKNFDAPFLPLFCYGLFCFWLFDRFASLVLIVFELLLTNYLFVQPIFMLSFTGAAGLTSAAYVTMALMSLWFLSSIFKNAKLQELLLLRANEAAKKNLALTSTLQDAISMRDSFVATAGHELRTPLTHMYLRTQNYIRRMADPNYVVDHHKILLGWKEQQRSIERMVRLVGQLLDVARIDSKQLALSVAPIAVHEIMQDLQERFEEQASLAGSRLMFTGGPVTNWSWDRDRFEQILSNLLNNALKYAPGVPVVVHWITDDLGLKLSVCDYGPGISAKDRSRIFDRFERIEPTNLKQSGLGLGLWICREIAEGAGGSLVLLEGNLGCHFELYLPSLTAQIGSNTAVKQGLTLVADA